MYIYYSIKKSDSDVVELIDALNNNYSKIINNDKSYIKDLEKLNYYVVNNEEKEVVYTLSYNNDMSMGFVKDNKIDTDKSKIFIKRVSGRSICSDERFRLIIREHNDVDYLVLVVKNKFDNVDDTMLVKKYLDEAIYIKGISVPFKGIIVLSNNDYYFTK